MKPSQQIDTLEDMLDHLIAEGETVALQRLRQWKELGGEKFGVSGLILSLAGKEDEDGVAACNR